MLDASGVQALHNVWLDSAAEGQIDFPGKSIAEKFTCIHNIQSAKLFHWHIRKVRRNE